MKYVKFVWEGYNDNYLTLGKVYEVIDYIKAIKSINDTITILNDKGNPSSYYLRTSYDIFFIEATAEIRSDTINEILL